MMINRMNSMNENRLDWMIALIEDEVVLLVPLLLKRSDDLGDNAVLRVA